MSPFFSSDANILISIAVVKGDHAEAGLAVIPLELALLWFIKTCSKDVCACCFSSTAATMASSSSNSLGCCCMPVLPRLVVVRGGCEEESGAVKVLLRLAVGGKSPSSTSGR